MKVKAFLTSGLMSLCFFSIGSNAAMKNATEFDWLATESAPNHYPMKIIQGEFYFHGQSGSRYIPSGGTLRAGWGSAISTHVGDEAVYPLPDRLSIVFFSLTENQFYKGEFNLPYDELLSHFRAGVDANEQSPYYREVMVGVAPGGAVAVWLTGLRTKEIFFGQAEKIPLRYGAATGLKFNNSHEEELYVREILEDVLKPDELESLKKNGVPFGLWSRYRNVYIWDFKSGNDVNFKHEPIGLKYLQGDSGGVSLPFSPEFIKTPRPLPRRMSITPPIY